MTDQTHDTTMTDDIPNDDDSTESTTHHRRTDHGVSITTEIKRGSGTRDQDKHVIKSKGETFDEAAHYHRQGLAFLDGGDLDDDRAVIDRVRDWQPEADDEQE